MTYPASPDDRVRPDAAQFWAGAVATAVVAALIALVGILVCRWTLNIPILAPAGEGAWGNAHTGEYALFAALVAVVAAGVLYLLALASQPRVFFNWIMGLATVAAVIYPFSSSAPFSQKGATAIVNLVLGLAITSLLTAVAMRAMRRVRPARTTYAGQGEAGRGEVGRGGYASQGQYSDQGQYGDQGYAPRQSYPGRVEDEYPTQVEQGYVPGQRAIPAEPTRPVNPSWYRRRR